MMPQVLKRQLCSLREKSLLHFRQATWRRRAMPDFIVIGAQKSGTSSLFSYLAQHPQLVGSSRKEVHYFDGGTNPDVDTFALGSSWYRSHFPLRRTLGDEAQTFEASPLYLFNPLVPERIADLVPAAKLIAVLRNPTERAISHYFHNRRRKREERELLEALEREDELLEPMIRQGDYKNLAYIHYSYKHRGLYRRQLERFYPHFPSQQILVLSSETLFGEPERVLQRVFEFVGVDAEYRVENLEPQNIGTSRSKVDSEVVDYLEDYFRPHNQALYDMIGEDFGW